MRDGFNKFNRDKTPKPNAPHESDIFGTAMPEEAAKTQRIDYGGEVKLKQSVDTSSCPGCGADMVFEPDKQQLHCPFCDKTVGVEKFLASERVLDFSLDNSRSWSKETRVFHCSSCGAETVFDKNEFAKVCPFCDSTAITQSQDLEGVRPDSVLPFRISKDSAGKSFAKWAKSKPFAPSGFKKNKAIESVKALYTPAWTFDANTHSLYDGVVGDYYYVTVGSGKDQRTERRVRYRNVAGQFGQFFDDVLVNAGAQVDEKTFNKLAPYPVKEAVRYDKNFLAGYHADYYKKSLRDGYGEAKQRIDSTIRSSIISSLHCDVVSHLNIRTRYSGNTFKYLLLPIYCCTYIYKEKVYRFFINGATAEVFGKSPVSPLRVTGLVLGILGIIAIVIMIMFFAGVFDTSGNF